MSEFNIAESTGISSEPYQEDPIIGVLASLFEQNIPLPINPRDIMGPDKLGREHTILDEIISPEGNISFADLFVGAGTGIKKAGQLATPFIRKLFPKFRTAPVYRGTYDLPKFTINDSDGKAVMKTLSPEYEDVGTFSSLNPYKALDYPGGERGYMQRFDVPIEELPHNIQGGGVAETQVFKKGIPLKYSKDVMESDNFRDLLSIIDEGKSVGQLSDEMTDLLNRIESMNKPTILTQLVQNRPALGAYLMGKGYAANQ